jgi:DNA repair protein RadD
MTMVSLRPYQVRAIEDVRQALRRGRKRVLLTVPTGGGKTLTAAAVLAAALAKGSRTLFAAHRKELIDQTCTTFCRLGVTSFGVVRAQDIRTDLSQPIQIASVQTLARRPVLEGIKIVVIDEAHRSVSPTYRKYLFDAYPEAVFLGLTATPCRGDGKPLGADWEELVIGARYSELIEGGHIVAPLVYSTPVLPDLTAIKTVAGDYDQEALEAAVNKGSLIGNVLEQWHKLAGGRTTVCFAVTVAHSQAIVAMFTQAGVRAEHLDGTTPEAERALILQRLADGVTQVVSQCGVLTEGWDLPSCKCAILARPTKSLGLYMQCAGRVLRPHEGIDPLILDHAGNFDIHGAPHEDREWSLSDKVKASLVRPTKCCKACFAYVPNSVAVCPHCSYVFVVAVPSEGEEVDTDAVPVDLALRSISGDDAQLAFFRKTSRTAREKGWKYGAIFHRFRERFGEDPRPDWVQLVKGAYRVDLEWKANVKEKEPMRKLWREQKGTGT